MNITIDISHFDPLIELIMTALLLMVLDWLLGIAAAIKAGTFDLRRAPDQLAHIAVPLILPLIVGVILNFGGAWYAAVTTAAGTVVFKLGVDVRDKVIALIVSSPPALLPISQPVASPPAPKVAASPPIATASAPPSTS